MSLGSCGRPTGELLPEQRETSVGSPGGYLPPCLARRCGKPGCTLGRPRRAPCGQPLGETSLVQDSFFLLALYSF